MREDDKVFAKIFSPPAAPAPAEGGPDKSRRVLEDLATPKPVAMIEDYKPEVRRGRKPGSKNKPKIAPPPPPIGKSLPGQIAVGDVFPARLEERRPLGAERRSLWSESPVPSHAQAALHAAAPPPAPAAPRVSAAAERSNGRSSGELPAAPAARPAWTEPRRPAPRAAAEEDGQPKPQGHWAERAQNLTPRYGYTPRIDVADTQPDYYSPQPDYHSPTRPVPPHDRPVATGHVGSADRLAPSATAVAATAVAAESARPNPAAAHPPRLEVAAITAITHAQTAEPSIKAASRSLAAPSRDEETAGAPRRRRSVSASAEPPAAPAPVAETPAVWQRAFIADTDLDDDGAPQEEAASAAPASSEATTGRARLRSRSTILKRYVLGTEPLPGERWRERSRRKG